MEKVLTKLYDDALRLPEFATKKLWTYIFNKIVFFDPQWIVGTEQPPTEYESLARIDVVVELFQNSSLSVVLIAEKKRGKANPSTIKSLEGQVYDRCKEYLQASDRDAVWAITCFGPNFRLWLCRRTRHSLKAVYPDVNSGSREAYCDVMKNWDDFLWYCNLIKENPEPSPSVMDQVTGKGKGAADVPFTANMQQAGESSGTYDQSLEGYYDEVPYNQPPTSIAGMDLQSGGPSHSQVPASSGATDTYWQTGLPSYEQNVASSSAAATQSTEQAQWIYVSRDKKGWTVTFADGRTKRTDKRDWTRTGDYWAWKYRDQWYYAKFKD